MKIAIITYDKPHRKTQDLIWRLLLNGYNDLELLIVKFIERKNFQPIYKHRPTNAVDVDISEMASILNIPYKDFIDQTTLNEYQYVLIGGAGILPAHGAINSHPGYLPNVRGLDALKWAIYEGQPIGVTTFYINEYPDAGSLIDRKIIPIYFNDTFHSVAQRVYETEIQMLVDAIGCTSSEELTRDYDLHRRMPHRKEIVMMERFNKLRRAQYAEGTI